MASHLLETTEGKRLADRNAWLQWGPYLAERQWGTVREDYSAHRRCLDLFSASSMPAAGPIAGARTASPASPTTGCAGACRWHYGTDATDILKERMFGLTNAQGNHGEDVKELYYFLDGTPTHSYMRMLYKYPQAAFPYDDLIAENAAGADWISRNTNCSTPASSTQNRYFDVTVEYAKATPDDILIRITIDNRGPDAADLHVLPQLWARNTWDWRPGIPEPRSACCRTAA